MTSEKISISEFDYPLPQERIASHPLQQRDHCKLLHLTSGGSIHEDCFQNIPQLLPSDTLLICNNTRVINARLRFSKATGGIVEIFCLEPVEPADYAVNFASTGHCKWLCLVGNSKRWKEGKLEMKVNCEGLIVKLKAQRISKTGNASIIEFSWEPSNVTFASIIAAAGEIPIPPYLNRATEQSDSKDYQTVYSRIDGSVAAPTAGLHFTDAVLEKLKEKNIPMRELTLHVGAGTFQPVKTDDISQHEMHSEFIAVPLSLINELISTDRKVYAVGTTSVRTLESLYHIGCLITQGEWTGEVPQWYPYSESHPHLTSAEALKALSNYLAETGQTTLVAATRIIIAPGYTYRIVKGIITNFHQPKSTLLLLVSAFIGAKWRDCYDYALKNDFRFLSYGDACLFEK